MLAVERHDNRVLWEYKGVLSKAARRGGEAAKNRENGRRLGYRWSPEVSHILDFSYIEINKTALNKSRTCTVERRKSGRNVGEKVRARHH